MNRRSRISSLAALAALSLSVFVAVPGAALPTTIDCSEPPTYCTSLHTSQIGADSRTFTQNNKCDVPVPRDCQNCNVSATDTQVDWHFVLTSTTSTPLTVGRWTLHLCFQNSGCKEVLNDNVSGEILHWDVITPSSDILLSACTDACTDESGLLNLSHVCCGSGDCGGGPRYSAWVTTEVHGGPDDTSGKTVVDNNETLFSPATVHDSATLTTVPAVSDPPGLPDGSTLTFSFFSSNDCSGDAGATATVDVGGMATPLTFDPELVESGLDAGGYSYNATFVDPTSTFPDAHGACEPFKIVAKPRVYKDTKPSIIRSYAWTCSKTADPTLIEAAAGIFNYEITVTKNVLGDSNFKVTGNITVLNPNSFPVTIHGVGDTIDNGGSCSITLGSTPAIVEAGGLSSWMYSCSFPSNPGAGINTAVIDWDADPANGLPAASNSGAAPYDFSKASIIPVDDCIELTDSYAGGPQDVICDTHTFTYSRTLSAVGGTCQKFANTVTTVAMSTLTSCQSSQTVEVCNPNTGALSMGYWKGPNGQNIIKDNCLCGTPTLKDYLVGFNPGPFKDLTAVTCNGVASYVSSILRAARAGGASMNAMLKGQMLATALDVYFSGLGSSSCNKINAPTPLGGVVIDLTKICTDLTCTGYENTATASAVFGGAHSLAVDDFIDGCGSILRCEANNSNSNGSTWYGQIKFPNQEYAKDTDDVVNNQVALLCP